MRTAFDDLRGEVEIPSHGTISRKLDEDERLRLVVFGFDAGQELTEHRSAAEVIVQVMSGRLTLTVERTRQTVVTTPSSRRPRAVPRAVGREPRHRGPCRDGLGRSAGSSGRPDRRPRHRRPER